MQVILWQRNHDYNAVQWIIVKRENQLNNGNWYFNILVFLLS